MANAEKILEFTTEPPQPAKVQFAEPIRDLLYVNGEWKLKDEAGENIFIGIGRLAGGEIIEALTPQGRRVADSVDILTSAAVLINNDHGWTVDPEPFMQGVIHAMTEASAWATREGASSILA